MVIDIFFVIFIGFSFYLGYTKGIVKSLFGIISIIIGILVSLKFSFLVIELIEQFMDTDPRLNILLGFVATFLIVMVGIRLIGKGFEKILETAHINFINQFAGGLLSALLALIIYSSIILFIDRLKFISASTKDKSITYPYLVAVPEKSRWLIEKSKPIFSEFWNKTQKALERLDKEIEDQKNADQKEQL